MHDCGHPPPLRNRIRDLLVGAKLELAAARRTAAWRKRWRDRTPTGFNDKIRYRMAFDRAPLLKTFVDKVAVRDYVAARVGEDVLPRVHLMTDDPRDIDLSALSGDLVIKPTHGSAAVLLIHGQADPEAEIPLVDLYPIWHREIVAVRRERVDMFRLRRLCRQWLISRYNRWEWAYRDVRPGLMVEEFLGHEDTPPVDYKFNVIGGEVHSITVMGGRTRQVTACLMRPDWSLLPVRMTHPHPDPLPRRPAHFDRMIEIARVLGRDTDMVRVDLYDVGGRVVFGELTPYPGGGRVVFDPPEFGDELLADWQPRRGRG
jgi:hypothetical protein